MFDNSKIPEKKRNLSEEKVKELKKSFWSINTDNVGKQNTLKHLQQPIPVGGHLLNFSLLN